VAFIVIVVVSTGFGVLLHAMATYRGLNPVIWVLASGSFRFHFFYCSGGANLMSGTMLHCDQCSPFVYSALRSLLLQAGGEQP